MAHEFQRNIEDVNLQVEKALPAAGASNTSDAIDIGNIGGIAPENVEVELGVEAVPALVDNKTITLELVTGATSSPTEKTGCQLVVTGGDGDGSGSAPGASATVARFRLPPNVKRYLAVKSTVAANGGNNTAKNATLKLLF